MFLKSTGDGYGEGTGGKRGAIRDKECGREQEATVQSNAAGHKRTGDEIAPGVPMLSCSKCDASYAREQPLVHLQMCVMGEAF